MVQEDEVVRDESGVSETDDVKVEASDRELSCQNCGAPLSYREGENVITCPYCGTTTMLAGFDNIIKIDSHFMLPVSVTADDAVATLDTWLSRGFHRSKKYLKQTRITETKGFMLPYWIVDSTATTMWRGKKKKTRTTGTGDKKKTETWYEPVSGSFSEDFTWPEYARENPEEYWGVASIQPGEKAIFPDWGAFWFRFGGGKRSPNRNLLDGQIPFDIETIKNSGMAENLINGQITQERAEANARAHIIEHEAKRAESKADVLTDVDTTVRVNSVKLVYIPMWKMKYTLGGKEYNALVSGTKREVLSAEYPVSKKAKIVVFDLMTGIPAIIAGLIGFSGEGVYEARIVAFVLAGLMLAYTLIKGLTGRN